MQDIDIYYESIRQVYNQIVDTPPPKKTLRERLVAWFVVVAIGTFALSFIPALPFVVASLGSRLSLVIGPLDLRTPSFITFALLWLGFTILSFFTLLFAIWIDSKPQGSVTKGNKPTQTLSPEQITFIAVYEAHKELKIYFVSHVDQHVEKSAAAVRRILPRARGFRPVDAQRLPLARTADPDEPFPPELLPPSRQPSSFAAQVKVAEAFLKTFQKYAWLNIDDSTKAILQALISFPQKISWRLARRDDLPSVLEVLENLSKFSYAYLPEHKTYMAPDALGKLHAEGARCLESFTKIVMALPNSSPPARPTPTKTEASLGWLDKVRRSGYLGVLARFSLWFVVLLALVTLAVNLLGRRYSISPDTLVTLIISTSIVGATALTGILPRRSKPDDKPQQDNS